MSNLNPKPTNLYEASDRLFSLGAKLADFECTGMTITGEGIRKMRKELREIAAIAKANEHEISCSRWAEQARADRKQTDKVLAAVQAKGSNVKLFPVVPRPTFYQDPKGGA